MRSQTRGRRRWYVASPQDEPRHRLPQRAVRNDRSGLPPRWRHFPKVARGAVAPRLLLQEFPETETGAPSQGWPPRRTSGLTIESEPQASLRGGLASTKRSQSDDQGWSRSAELILPLGRQCRSRALDHSGVGRRDEPVWHDAAHGGLSGVDPPAVLDQGRWLSRVVPMWWRH